jgi:hypothetical protein
LIRNEKPIVLFERHCHATEKSEAIARARRCRSSWLTRRRTKKNNWEKTEDRGGGKAQGVADPKNNNKFKCRIHLTPSARSRSYDFRIYSYVQRQRCSRL